MRAVILAGGKGTRLRPYTTLIPKPLVPLGGKYSILEVVLKQLHKAGFTHVTMAVNHLSHLIESFFGDGNAYGIKIDYSHEDKELSTIGPLTLIPDLPENFLVMNGDILCDLNYRDFYEAHIREGSRVSVATYRRQTKIDFGVLHYDANNLVHEFQEKPVYDFDVSMGIYCLNYSVVKSLPKGTFYGFDHLMHDSISNNLPVIVRPFHGYWLDIGRPDDYESANQNFEELLARLGVE
jgi:NDP-mannose synthase